MDPFYIIKCWATNEYWSIIPGQQPCWSSDVNLAQKFMKWEYADKAIKRKSNRELRRRDLSTCEILEADIKIREIPDTDWESDYD